MNNEISTLETPATTADVARQLDAPDRQGTETQHASLLSSDVTDRLQADWQNVQASFVDEPRQAVQRADELVAFAIKQIAETFARERSTLEAQWDRDGEVSTEDLRVALTKYRSFFHRLLSM